MRFPLPGCALLLALVANPVAVRAQDAPETNESVARGLFEAGRAAFDGGQYRDALQLFDQAYERSPRPQLLYNIGQAADRLRMDERALEVFRRYITELPDAANRTEVDNRIRALEEILTSREAGTTTETPATGSTAAPATELNAPTPTETAHASSLTAPTSPAAEPLSSSSPHAEQSTPITQQWWFWTAIGVVVAGGVVVAAVAASGSESPSPEYVQGDIGQVAVTLRRP